MAPLKPTALTHPAHAPPSAAAASKKLYTFKPSATAGNTSGAFKKAAFKKQKALFSIARAKHQKGPLAGSFTNHIISFLRGANLDNDKLRAALTPFLLGERLKWNNDQVAFSVRIYTKKQAAKILAAMRAYLGAADAADLPEAVDDAPWSDDTNAAVSVVPCKRIDENANLQDGGAFAEDDVILLDGVTYPLKEELKEMGFRWTTDFNGIEGAVRAPPWPPCAPFFSRPCHCPLIPAHARRTTGCARPSTSTPTRSWTSSTSGAGSSRSTTGSTSRRPPRHRAPSSSTLLPRPIALVRARQPMRVICT